MTELFCDDDLPIPPSSESGVVSLVHKEKNIDIAEQLSVFDNDFCSFYKFHGFKYWHDDVLE